MATKNIANGKVVNTIEFNIDTKSWKNLDLFQKRLKDLKKQMSGLSANVKVNASMKQFATQVENNTKRITKAKTVAAKSLMEVQKQANNSSYAGMWKDLLKADETKAYTEALSLNNKYSKDKQNQLNKAHTEALRDDKQRTKETIRQQLRSQREHAQALGMNSRFDKGKNSRRDTASIAVQRMYDRMQARGVNPNSIRADVTPKVHDLSRQFISGRISAQRYRAELGRIANQHITVAQSTQTLGSRYKELRSNILQATAAFTAYSALSDVFNTGKQLQALEAGMTIFAKNEAGVRENMEYIRNLSLELGTNFMVAAKEFTKFSIVSKNKMSVDDTRALFRAYSEVATVQQMDTVRFERGLNALNIGCFIQ